MLTPVLFVIVYSNKQRLLNETEHAAQKQNNRCKDVC